MGLTTLSLANLFETDAAGQLSPQFTLTDPGSYYITLRVTDDIGQSRERLTKLVTAVSQWSTSCLRAILSG